MEKDFDFADFLLQFYSRSEWRRSKVILNNLIGRRTVSNLFWGMQYGLLPFFNLFPKLKQDTFDHYQKYLAQTNLIQIHDTEAQLTQAGQQRKEAKQKAFLRYKFSGIGLYTNLTVIQDCLNLSVQITSEFAYQNNRYYPLQYSGRVMNFCKRWFHINSTQKFPDEFHAELTEFLETLNSKDADVFVAGFVGHNTFGLTDQQIETNLNLTSFEWQLKTLDLITQFIRWSSDGHRINHPLCTQLITPWLNDSPLSMSSATTYQQFLNNYTIEMIAQKRKVKVNTIREHLLEAAILKNNFPFQSFLSKPLPDKLHKYLQDNASGKWQFTDVTELAPEISFFEFRLLQIREVKSKNDD